MNMTPLERARLVAKLLEIRKILFGDQEEKAEKQEPPKQEESPVPKRDAEGRKVVLQNRDRKTKASISQMQSIASNPDYMMLSPGRSFSSGAPVVAYGNVDAQHLGKKDIAAASNHRRIPFQYAVVEADEVLTSNLADGTTVPEYDTASADHMRAVAGNGRMAGVRAAYEKGTAENYRKELIEDTDLHGIDPEVIKSMKKPVLVRIMPDEEVTADIGDLSNTTGNLDMNVSEVARNDAERLKPSDIRFEMDGTVSKNTVLDFIYKMPESERGPLLKDSQPSRQGIERFNNAVMQMAYNSDEIVQQYAMNADPDIKTVTAALNMAAPYFARIQDAGFNFGELVAKAAQLIIDAKRKKQDYEEYFSQTDMFGETEDSENIRNIARALVANIRSGKRMGEMLVNAAQKILREAESQVQGAGLFGDEMPPMSRQEMIDLIIKKPEEETANPQLF